jgi:hypothetical protein
VTIVVPVHARDALIATAWSGCLQRIPSGKGVCHDRPSATHG